MSDMKIWIGCLACYNEGQLSGKWYSADQGDDVEIGDVCGAGSHALHEELWVFDHEGFGGLLSGECSPSEAARIYDVVQHLDDDRLEAFGCWVSHRGASVTSGALSDFEDAYRGRWDSEVEYAQELADDIGAVPESLGWPLSYIDWDRAARDLFMDYWAERASSGGIHVFSSH